MTILEALDDTNLFGQHFRGDSWTAWRAFLAAVFGLPMTAETRRVFRECTGRKTPPKAPAREAWVIVGRRGGKSRIAALIAVYLACFRDYRKHLAPGEVGTLAVIAADRKQARTVFRYVSGFFGSIPILGNMVLKGGREAIELTNRTVIEIHTCSFRAVRGYTLLGVVADEVAFWSNDETGANPDVEILNGLRPGMATIPGAMLVAISSPYARRGALWDAYRRFWGTDGDVLVWRAPTRTMNPLVPEDVVRTALEEDEAAARAEYLAEFRRDIESYVDREAVESCVVSGRRELPPCSELRYVAFVDPSGGGRDSMTLAIAHAEQGRVVLDAVRERRPPFDPSAVVREFAELLRQYRIGVVHGDRYSGEWVRECFREHGIDYRACERSKSELYGELLPRLNAGTLELLDNARLLGQLASLERRTSRGGRDTIDHPPGGRDDLANAVAGVVWLAGRKREVRMVAPISIDVRPSPWELAY